MKKNPAAPLPRMRALRTFEAVARHLHFTRAAEELEIQQPAVSRYISELENQIGSPLFHRHHRSVSLTATGEIYHRAVTAALERLAAGALTVSDLAGDRRVVIACGGATSELFLRPRLNALHGALGETAVLRLLHCENDYLYRPDVVNIDRIDLITSYHGVGELPCGEAVYFPEKIAAVCSPEFAATHADTLRRPVVQWSTLPFLSFAWPTLGWATWDDWFEIVGYPQPPPRYRSYEDYVYLLEAAVAGQGLALGWRNFTDRFLAAGSLVMAGGEFVAFDRPLTVRLTERGSRRPIARQCLAAFAALAGEQTARD